MPGAAVIFNLNDIPGPAPPTPPEPSSDPPSWQNSMVPCLQPLNSDRLSPDQAVNSAIGVPVLSPKLT